MRLPPRIMIILNYVQSNKFVYNERLYNENLSITKVSPGPYALFQVM